MKHTPNRRHRGEHRPAAAILLSAVASLLLASPPAAGGTQPVKLNGPLVSGGDLNANYSFTPDGSRVVYSADQETAGTDELYSVPAGGGVVTKLNRTLRSDDVGFIGISPDSSRVVYSAAQDTAGKKELYSVPVGGGTSVKLNAAVSNSVSSYSVAISPDSSLVAYRADQDTAGVYDLYCVPIGGGTSTKLNVALGSGDQIFGIKFSPDSSRVVYSVSRSANSSTELYSVPVTGGASAALSGPTPANNYNMSFAISPDGSRVVYWTGTSDFNNDHCNLYSVPIAGGTPPVMLNDPIGWDETVIEFKISPNSSRVVYTTLENSLGIGYYSLLHSIPLAGGTPTLLCTDHEFSPDDHSSVEGFEIAPDSSQVFYLADQDTNDTLEVYRVPLAGGAQERLNAPLPPGRSVSEFIVSPDGSRVVYKADQDSQLILELYSVPSGGGTPVRINAPLAANQQIGDFKATPDSSRIIYQLFLNAGTETHLCSASIRGGGESVRLDTGSGRISDFKIAPHSTHVAYLADKETTSVYELFSRPIQVVWNNAGGHWETWSNWTPDSAPDTSTGAAIQTSATVTLTGNEWSPAHAAILDLGGSSSGSSILDFANGAVLQLDAGLVLWPGGILRGDGTLATGNTALDIPAGAEIAAEDGERLHIAAGPVENAGLVDAVGLVAPAEIEFDAPLANASGTGYIAAHNATLRFGGGLDNNGSAMFTGDSNIVFGDIDNGPTGQVIVSGGATAIFHDDVANAGVIQVSASGNLASSAVFSGGCSGQGVAGGGHVFLEGDTRPGFSPGAMVFGGDVSLGPVHMLEVEIAGTTPGTEYDRLEVAGTLDLGGALAVSFINGFSPAPGNSFDIWDAASSTGAFASVSLPPLPAGLFWHRETLDTDGVLSVALSPASYAEFAAAYSLAGNPEADDDHDGVSNLLEYLHGLDPTSPDTGISRLSLVRDGADDELFFALASPGGTDLHLEIQTSTDMDAWQTLANRAPDGTWSGPLPVSVSAAGPGRARVTLRRPADTARRFYRLAVSLENP